MMKKNHVMSELKVIKTKIAAISIALANPKLSHPEVILLNQELDELIANLVELGK